MKKNNEIVETFAAFAKHKNIDRPTTIKIIEDVFKTIIHKKYGYSSNFDITINVDNGDLEIWKIRKIVDDEFVKSNSYDINKHISLTDARLIESDFELDEDVSDKIEIEKFGRRIIQTAKQSLINKIKDYDRNQVIERYKELVGEIVTAEVMSFNKGDVFLIDSWGNELYLPKYEQIRKDRFSKGDQVKALVYKVELLNDNTKIILSRNNDAFLSKLLELEIPEISDGLIQIKRIAREAGEKSKIAVETLDSRIDPIGTIIGTKGYRINSITKELNNEYIEVINFTENRDLLIQRALTPAKIDSITYEGRKIYVNMKPDQIGIAIGKGGINIKLASKLVNCDIEISKEIVIDDVELDEFADEIDSWVINEFKKIGLDTAKQVLESDINYLIKKTDLEEETVINIIDILKKEFE